ncbi:damage-inducible protein [Haemophilus paracuniculus]|uniref:Damage-inducible protein n=1 Tax=Haemophilus paracuniculus TaxID=734 RepID=A0A1T0AV23_9PAST|nr:damage-inducible protein [Haemophilus paracuniculus]
MNQSSALSRLLADYQAKSLTEREKGTYFEQLTQLYFKHEPFYQTLYKEVLTFKDWAETYYPELPSNDTGIDLVALTHSGETHAIQCKNYAIDHKISKSDIDSFFTASGKKYFDHRIIVATTDEWTDNAYASLADQNPPVTLINRSDLENSAIDWQQFETAQTIELKTKKTLREHQQTALKNVVKGLETADRGKLIMACGTGKTFTSLKIAEEMAGKGKKVLFLVPSLALLSQSLTEWTQESETPLHSFAVCSDSDVGKQNKGKIDDDRVQLLNHELRFPATTNASGLIKAINAQNHDLAMTVIFSTYHSIDVIHQAQQLGLGEFDLVICDEAHRTTGTKFKQDEKTSPFIRIHDNDYIQAAKRLYMTATPRIYGEKAKETDDLELLYSMDDPASFGETLHTISFSEAVKRKLLVDYKVLVLAVEESHIRRHLDLANLSVANGEIEVDDAAKIVGCWKALSKYGVTEDLDDDKQAMKRAVAFCQVIEPTDSTKNKFHKVSSKQIAEIFDTVVSAYQRYERQHLDENDEQQAELAQSVNLKCEAQHVDGSMNASEKASKISWLKEETDENCCRILSNVRCLSEGVDVPALDAVLFLTPRNSEVDVVQSVGRVMRNAPNKKRGYIVLPVVIPAALSPEEALNKNENYKVVWEVLNALRAHDDRFDAMINAMEFDKAANDKIEVIAVVDHLARKKQKPTANKKKKADGKGQNSIGKADPTQNFNGEQYELPYEIGDIELALKAKIVKRCGKREYWEDWAKEVAKIANEHIQEINEIIANPENKLERAMFEEFAQELKDDLNTAISESEIVEMLAQHQITEPVFNALFANAQFTQQNPMSQAIQQVIEVLNKKKSFANTKKLDYFYNSIKEKIAGIKTAEGKQHIIKQLYDSFFNKAFPKMAERLGIVYTPVEVVDFIIHSVEHILNSEFNSSLKDNGVQIIDPFTGTGTFITRLLQSGIIPADKLPEKYKEIHANEMVLLAYYIAAINIESVYHALLEQHQIGKAEYQPFEGICLTDTFQMYEKEDMVDQILEVNSKRRKKQKTLDIKVIIGNPPYSAGQESANDNNANIAYPHLDEKIRSTYAEYSTSTNKNALYDSYIRAIRWASDRIKGSGIIGFVTNGGYLESNSADGLRKCLAEEFSSLYIFHLRGNQRTSGERSRKEGGKIFGSGSRAPIAIAILVKNPTACEMGKIYFHDIGDYLTREQKLEKIQQFRSIAGISEQDQWTQIIPDQFNDWLNQRDPNFDSYIELGNKEDKNVITIFENYSRGVATARDAWVYNFSKENLTSNMRSMIKFYNQQVLFFLVQRENNENINIDEIIDLDPTKISWNRSLKNDLSKARKFNFDDNSIRLGMYRPYTQSNIYFNRTFNDMVYQMFNIFPTKNTENKVICITGRGATTPFSILITDKIPDLGFISTNQCFPLYLYEKTEPKVGTTSGLFEEENGKAVEGYQRKEAITDESLAHFQTAYPNQPISKEDIFYYIYGLLHSEDYRQKYADNLSKQLPRIPCVKKVEDFQAFCEAGRALAEWHLNYENAPLYQGVKLSGGGKLTENGILGGVPEDFYVEKMKFASKEEKSKILYNKKITVENIPEQAFDYIVNGKSAIEWVMERQGVKIDKASGIVNDANDWAKETMNNPRYPLELLLRVITVSIETMKIVNNLPKLVI